MLFEELLLLKFIFIYFDTLKDTKPLIFTLTEKIRRASRPSMGVPPSPPGPLTLSKFLEPSLTKIFIYNFNYKYYNF